MHKIHRSNTSEIILPFCRHHKIKTIFHAIQPCTVYEKNLQFVYKTMTLAKRKFDVGLPILGSKGREPRKGTFMSSAIF